MRKFEGEEHIFYCEHCDIVWDGYSETKYPSNSFVHARAKLGIEWMAFTDAIKKELEPLIVLVLNPINKILVKIVEHLREKRG